MVWHERWLWLGGSLLLAVLWANLTWVFRQPVPGAAGKFLARLISWRFSPWLLQFFRLLYYVGLPVAALLLGHDAVIEKILGLKFEGGVGIDTWARGLGWAAALGVGAWMLLALGWWTYRRALAAAGESAGIAGNSLSGWTLLREAVYHEVHWAFYRNAFIVVGGDYWGVWSGLVLVGLEAALNPAWRAGLSDPRQSPIHLMRGALAVVSSALFLLTQNLWLAIAVHWGMSWGLTVLAQGRSANVMRDA